MIDSIFFRYLKEGHYRPRNPHRLVQLGTGPGHARRRHVRARNTLL